MTTLSVKTINKAEIGREYWFKGKVTQVDEGDSQPYKVCFGDGGIVDYIWIPEQVEMVEVISERKKVVIPKFVADWIEACKNEGRVLEFALSKAPRDVKDWLYDGSGDLSFSVFARAWLDGYEIEKEPLYWVRDKNGDSLLCKSSSGIRPSGGLSPENQRQGREFYAFTEKEIKDYDERYWAFVVPVEEEE